MVGSNPPGRAIQLYFKTIRTVSGFHLRLDKCYGFSKEAALSYVQDLIRNILPAETDLVISSWHESQINYFTEIFDYIKNQPFRSVTLVVDPYQKQLLPDNISFTVVYANMVLLATNRWFKCDSILDNRPNVGLLLTGRLGKPHRIGLLKQLYDTNFLQDNVIWSFPEYWHKEELKQFVYNKENYDDFFSYAHQHAFKDDQPVMFFRELGNFYFHNFNNSGYVSHLYNCTNFSIISETYITDLQVVTEKTYRAILNKHPFVIAAARGTLNYLEELGFKTFKEYLPISDYDKIDNNIDRINAVAINSKALQKIATRPDVLLDVEYNYQLFCQILKKDVATLTGIRKQAGLPSDDVYNEYQLRFMLDYNSVDDINNLSRYYDLKTNDKNFVVAYNNIKDSSWPEINSRREFFLLPTSIQQECIELFNLPV